MRSRSIAVVDVNEDAYNEGYDDEYIEYIPSGSDNDNDELMMVQMILILMTIMSLQYVDDGYVESKLFPKVGL